MAKKHRPLTDALVSLFQRNEAYVNGGEKPMTDEDLLIHLTHEVSPHNKTLQALLRGKTTIAKLRAQFNRGKMHRYSLTPPPNFFSFRYDDTGQPIYKGCSRKPLTKERQARMVAAWKDSRLRHHRRRQARVRGEECSPKRLFQSFEPCLGKDGTTANAAPCRPTADE